MLAVHAAVFPLDRQRAGVAGGVQARMISSKFTPPRPSERKSQPRCGSPKFRWLDEDAAAAVERHDRVLHVDVVDAVGERRG